MLMHVSSCTSTLLATPCPNRPSASQAQRSTGQNRIRNRWTACRAQQGDMQVLAIPGSLRKASTNNGLIRAAVRLAPPGMQIAIADISQMPLYNDDLWESGVPASVSAFRDQIQAADALLFSVPEYNYSLPGPLKNAIDWASHPNVFAGKPATMMEKGVFDDNGDLTSEKWKERLQAQLEALRQWTKQLSAIPAG